MPKFLIMKKVETTEFHVVKAADDDAAIRKFANNPQKAVKLKPGPGPRHDPVQLTAVLLDDEYLKRHPGCIPEITNL